MKPVNASLPVPEAFPPGYFLSGVLRHDWPPGFAPQAIKASMSAAQAAQMASQRRARDREAGAAWAQGTVLRPGDRGARGVPGGADVRGG